ncbi:hypothetical protein ES708_17259 [subsurface metagenome]
MFAHKVIVDHKIFKSIVFDQDPIGQLFDMENDRGETKNLFHDSTYVSVVKEHKELLVEWESQLEVAPDLPHADAWWRNGKVIS